MIMQQGRVNLVSVHGVPWAENITLLRWKIVASHLPMVRMLTISKNNCITAASKITPSMLLLG